VQVLSILPEYVRYVGGERSEVDARTTW